MISTQTSGKIEKLKEIWLQPHTADKKLLKDACDYSIEKTREKLKEFTYAVPSITAPNGQYSSMKNENWATGFWPGMVWIAYALTKDKDFLNTGKIQSILFKERLETNNNMQHHDIGFLYSLSAVADYILTGDAVARETGIDAAYKLTKMYRKIPGIIQRQGDLDNHEDVNTGVFIVDCMNNVPLLFWANKQNGDSFLYEVAYNHMKNSMNSLIKPNGRVIHHGVADIVTGEIHADPNRSQGKGGDDATWARGQAWAIAGLPITYSYTGKREFLETAKKVAVFFLNRMPSDLVADWDLYYTDDLTQRDTSASSIAASGLLEIAEYLEEDDPYKEIFKNAAYRILESLAKNYLTKGEPDNMGILNAGVYCYNYKGTDEPNLWGDYYFMEALYRIFGDFKRFW